MGSTLITLVQKCRFSLGELTPRFYTDPEIKNAIGDSYRYYTDWLVRDGEGYFTLPTTVGFTGGTNTIDVSTLTPAFYKIGRLERNTSNGTIPLKKSERRFVPNFTINSGTGDSYQPTYRTRGLNIILEPTPQNTEAGTATTGLYLEYVYIPDFPAPNSADSFQFDASFPAIWESMVCDRATIEVLETKDAMGGVSDISSFNKRLAEKEESFDNSIERAEYPDSVQYVGMSYNNTYNWR